MARTDPQLNIRIPAELKAALDAVAAENKKSTTAEIVSRLQASFYDAGNGETKGKLIVALTTLRMLHHMTTDPDLKRDVGTMLAFMGSVDGGTDVLAATQALARLHQHSIDDKKAL